MGSSRPTGGSCEPRVGGFALFNQTPLPSPTLLFDVPPCTSLLRNPKAAGFFPLPLLGHFFSLKKETTPFSPYQATRGWCLLFFLFRPPLAPFTQRTGTPHNTPSLARRKARTASHQTQAKRKTVALEGEERGGRALVWRANETKERIFPSQHTCVCSPGRTPGPGSAGSLAFLCFFLSPSLLLRSCRAAF